MLSARGDGWVLMHGARQRNSRFWTAEMLSWPAATTAFMPSWTTWCAAIAIAISPEAHWRSMVWPGTVTGSPAAMSAWRAMFSPAVPAVSTLPTTTSSISSGATDARSTAWAIAWPASEGERVRLNAPLNARPIGVRA